MDHLNLTSSLFNDDYVCLCVWICSIWILVTMFEMMMMMIMSSIIESVINDRMYSFLNEANISKKKFFFFLFFFVSPYFYRHSRNNNQNNRKTDRSKRFDQNISDFDWLEWLRMGGGWICLFVFNVWFGGFFFSSCWLKSMIGWEIG